ncbi:hypothetical protein ABZ897_51010 [Nonomuraea sp. NPDC046802]|uniref:hypothetical protein n=1 Tax=Nonomuraea sp. NPDC046802 TaxID=3154919 RepID=UPI0033C20131
MPDAFAAVWGDNIDLDRPYFGWINHNDGDWQAVLVYQKGGTRQALPLGAEMPLRRAVELCQIVADQTGTQLAGELSKRDGFLPLAMGGTP